MRSTSLLNRNLAPEPAPGVFVHTYDARIPYVDTDQGSVVHHAAYLRYFEMGRVEYLRTRGVEYRALEVETRIGLPVVDCQLSYRKPARFDDLVMVRTWLADAGRAKMVFVADMILADFSGARLDVLCCAQITLAAISLDTMTLVSLPMSLRSLSAD